MNIHEYQAKEILKKFGWRGPLSKTQNYIPIYVQVKQNTKID